MLFNVTENALRNRGSTKSFLLKKFVNKAPATKLMTKMHKTEYLIPKTFYVWNFGSLDTYKNKQSLQPNT